MAGSPPAIGIQHAFMHHLAQRRMREDGVHQVFLGGLQVHGHDIALDQFGDFRADHVRAEKLAGLLASKTVLIMPSGSPSAMALPLPMKGKRPTLTSCPASLALASVRPTTRPADGNRCSRGSSSCPSDGHRLAGDLLDADHALMLGLVRQHGRPGDIADGVDALDDCVAIVDRPTMPRSVFTPSASRPRFFDVADDADGGNQLFGFDASGLCRPWSRHVALMPAPVFSTLEPWPR
jgi:hypothetical protein